MISDQENQHLHRWLVKVLENRSQAEPEVLAEYVAVLFKSDEPEDKMRENAVSELQDFLQDNTAAVVDDVLKALRTKSYMPNRKPLPPPKTSNSMSLDSIPSVLHPPTSSKKRSYDSRNGGGQQSPQHPRRFSGDRPMKQRKWDRDAPSAAGGTRGPGSQFPRQNIPSQNRNTPIAHQQSQQAYPFSGQGSPNLFQNGHPMQSRNNVQLTGWPQQQGFPMLDQGQNLRQGRQNTSPGNNLKCPSFSQLGFCLVGPACPLDHGVTPSHANGTSDDFAPDDLMNIVPTHLRSQGANNQLASPRNNAPGQRGGSSHRGSRGRSACGRRAPFSYTGPSTDTGMFTIVVEQIPEQSYSHDNIKTYFSDFGEVDDVSMQDDRHLAIIRFSNHESARRAYESPKAIFDNRFVKVYWYKPDKHAMLFSSQYGAKVNGKAESAANESQEPDFDPEEFQKRQEAAQRAHEEKTKKATEAAEKKAELDKRIKEHEEQRKRIFEQLNAKSGGAATTNDTVHEREQGNGEHGNDEAADRGADSAKSSARTEELRAQYARLVAEAERMGVPADDNTSESTTNHPLAHSASWRGRGGFSRASSRGRGAGTPYAGFRGGRGGARWPGYNPGQARPTSSIDFRPKNVAVTVIEDERRENGHREDASEETKEGEVSVDFSEDKCIEVLKRFLMNIGEYTRIAASPPTEPDTQQKPTTAVISFPVRYIGENFVKAVKAAPYSGVVPGLGRVEMSWVAEAPAGSTGSPDEAAEREREANENGVGDGEGGDAEETEEQGGGEAGASVGEWAQDGGAEGRDGDMDFDVAD